MVLSIISVSVVGLVAVEVARRVVVIRLARAQRNAVRLW
jgi:hypothetical protein